MSRAARAADLTGEDLRLVEAKLKEMGRELRKHRKAAKLTQDELGAKVPAARGTISNAENGSRNFARNFWAGCDRALGLGTHFTGWYDRIYAALLSPAGIRPDPVAELPVSGILTDPADLAEALAEYRHLGWPAVERPGGRLALVTGDTVDALEVSRATGVIAAHWWLETGGREDQVRGLPVLPPPATCLAAVDAGDRWYFLTRSGASPWPAPRQDDRDGATPVPARLLPHVNGVTWHAARSSIPLPPSSPMTAGAGPVTWGSLPGPVLRLVPPMGVLHLLGRAAVMARSPGALVLPGGALVTPAGTEGMPAGPGLTSPQGSQLAPWTVPASSRAPLGAAAQSQRSDSPG